MILKLVLPSMIKKFIFFKGAITVFLSMYNNVIKYPKKITKDVRNINLDINSFLQKKYNIINKTVEYKKFRLLRYNKFKTAIADPKKIIRFSVLFSSILVSLLKFIFVKSKKI